MNKRELRSTAIARRNAMPPEARAEQSRQITRRLLDWREFVQAKTVLLYASIQGEVESDSIICAAFRSGKVVALPITYGRGEMAAARFCQGEPLSVGLFGVPEPPRNQVLPPDAFDLILLPGLMFDLGGVRLGFGAGYYDRYLPKTRACVAGVAYGWQVVSALPRQAHDVPVNALVTPVGIIDVKR